MDAAPGIRTIEAGLARRALWSWRDALTLMGLDLPRIVPHRSPLPGARRSARRRAGVGFEGAMAREPQPWKEGSLPTLALRSAVAVQYRARKRASRLHRYPYRDVGSWAWRVPFPARRRVRGFRVAASGLLGGRFPIAARDDEMSLWSPGRSGAGVRLFNEG